MTERTLTNHISSNYIRAQQAQSEGDDRVELKHLLLAAEDICKLLLIWHMLQLPDPLAAGYAASAHDSTARIKELIDNGALTIQETTDAEEMEAANDHAG